MIISIIVIILLLLLLLFTGYCELLRYLDIQWMCVTDRQTDIQTDGRTDAMVDSMRCVVSRVKCDLSVVYMLCAVGQCGGGRGRGFRVCVCVCVCVSAVTSLIVVMAAGLVAAEAWWLRDTPPPHPGSHCSIAGRATASY